MDDGMSDFATTATSLGASGTYPSTEDVSAFCDTVADDTSRPNALADILGEVIVEVEAAEGTRPTEPNNAVVATVSKTASAPEDDEDGQVEVFDEQGNVAAVIKEFSHHVPFSGLTAKKVDADTQRAISQQDEIRAAELAFGVDPEVARIVAVESGNGSSAGSQAVADDFGIGYQRVKVPGSATEQHSYSIRTANQSFPSEQQLLSEASSNEHVLAALSHTIAQSTTNDDDEFDYEVDTHSFPAKVSGAYAGQGMPSMLPESPVVTPEPEELEHRPASPSSALALVRAQMVAQQQAEHAATVKEMEARMLASSEVANISVSTAHTAGPNVLNALVEGEDEETENEADESSSSKPSASILTAAVAASVATETDEAALLAAEFEMATASHQLRVQQTASRGATHIPGIESAAVSFEQLSRHLLRSAAVATHQGSVVVSAPDPSLGCFGRLLAVKLAAPCQAERLAIFCAAKQMYEEGNEIHRETFPTLFAGITGTRFVGARSSWTLIGFQRDADFSTDLRGAGMLGPLQALWLTQTHKPFVHKLYQLSQNEHQSFPFMIQSISITAKALQALRLGRLDAVANRHFRRLGAASEGQGGPVLLAFNEYFAAFWFAFYAEWVGSGASIARMGTVMNQVSQTVESNVAGAIARFNEARSRPPFVDAAPQASLKTAPITTQAAMKSEVAFSASSNPMASRRAAYATK